MEFKIQFYLLLVLEVILVPYVAGKKFLCRLFGARPKYNSWFYDRLAACEQIKKTAEKGQTALSLNVVYNYPTASRTKAADMDQWLEYLWMNMPSAQALRSRLAIVTSRLEAEVRRLWEADNRQPINIVFFAGGFVETGIQVVKNVRQDGIRVNCLVLDISKEALAHARENSQHAGVADCFSFTRMNLLNRDKVAARLSGMKVQIIEMIGILDYLDEQQAIQLFQLAESVLAPGGMLLTGNILTTVLEAPFLYTVINWPKMKHRTVRGFRRLLEESGITEGAGHVPVHIDPHKVFAVFEVRTAAQGQPVPEPEPEEKENTPLFQPLLE